MAQRSLVLSPDEFDVAWESENLPQRHVAIDVPSAGKTHSQRAEIVAGAWESLNRRGLAHGTLVDADLADRLALLAHYTSAVDAWVWTDRRISALAATNGIDAHLAVLEDDEVWLIPARPSSLAACVVAVAGEAPAGEGRSVSLPIESLRAADAAAEGDPTRLVTCLERAGVGPTDARSLAAMFGMVGGLRLRGQFGAESRDHERRIRRANRVVSCHDTAAGRYLYLCEPGADGSVWATVTPVDAQRLTHRVAELLDEP